jgi:hypothetical protein
MEEVMSRIDVVTDGNMFKIMVNFVKRHSYSTPELANSIATKIHDKELPTYQLNLAEV